MIHDTIKQRLRASLLLTPAPKVAHALALRHAASQQSDGSWSDQPVGELVHLERTLVLSKALRPAAGALDDSLRRAFDFWLAHDFITRDWRRDQIVIPRLVGEIALLGEHGLSAGAAGKVMEILARSRWANWVSPAGWVECTGTTLLGVAYNHVLRGSLENAPSLFDAAFGRVFREIRPVNSGEDGIQTDMTFRAPVGASMGGGFAFMRECAQFIALAHGTPWQAPPEMVKLFAAFVLDGQQWIMRHETVDADAPGDVSSTADDFAGVAAIVQQLAQLGNPPRRQELAGFAHRLQGRGEALSGHRYFWRARMAVHQRPDFYISLRLAAAQPGSPSVADGRTSILRAGDEYRGLPTTDAGTTPSGTTMYSGVDVAVDDPSRPVNRPGEWLSGGVSEGDCGLAATELRRPGLTGKKAWIFFDESLVCLGTDLLGTTPGGRVSTTVNHCRLRGEISVRPLRGERRALPPVGEQTLTSIHTVEHDGLSYVFPESCAVLVRSGGYPADPVADFQLQIEHGPQPRGVSYTYVVLPTDDDSTTASKIVGEVSRIEVLSNTPALQAARHGGLGLLGVAFWEPGVMLLPGGGRVAANHPCLLLCRELPDGGTRLSISNPGTRPAIVHVEYGGKCVCFELPGGPDSGRSMSRLI